MAGWCSRTLVLFQQVLPIGGIGCTAARSQIVCWPSFCRWFPRILRGSKWVSSVIEVLFGNGQFFHCLCWILKVSSYYISATFSRISPFAGRNDKAMGVYHLISVLCPLKLIFDCDAIVRAVNATQYYQGFLFRSVASLGFRYLFPL